MAGLRKTLARNFYMIALYILIIYRYIPNKPIYLCMYVYSVYTYARFWVLYLYRVVCVVIGSNCR